jgi:hypothetical protein
MRLVLAATWAELLEFKPFCRGFLILRVAVVPFFALGALERDDFARHISSRFLTNLILWATDEHR